MTARFLRSLFTLWAVLTLTFVIAMVLPSDPARIAAGPQARPADIAAIRNEMGVDQPLSVRYRKFMSRLMHVASSEVPVSLSTSRAPHANCMGLGRLHIDLGRSYQQRRPVLAILAERLPRTLFLAWVSVLLQLLIGVTLGSFAAQNPGRLGRTLMSLSLVTVSFPTFALGVLMQYLFAYRLGLLPIDGFGTTNAAHLAAVILPSLTLGLYGSAYYARLANAELRRELASDYVRTARAKGASRLRALIVHAMRNMLLPVGTAATLDFGALIGGAIVTESVFRWPGIGQLAITALLDRDMPVLMGTVLVSAVAVMLANGLADALYGWLDPRIRGR
jgi:peptide/nickel transport system permease protein